MVKYLDTCVNYVFIFAIVVVLPIYTYMDGIRIGRHVFGIFLWMFKMG